MSKTVCITGGCGMIGSVLRAMLADAGYKVSVLSRSGHDLEKATVYTWAIDHHEIDKQAIESADVIIHLAGANIGAKRWTYQRKKEIRDSRIKSTEFLYDTLAKMDKRPELFISASASGVYGQDTGGIWMEENRVRPGDDFVATVAREWEDSINKIKTLGIRLVILRQATVLSMKGGALPRLVAPVKFWVGAPLASGEQYLSWIHIKDACRLMQYCIENKNTGGIYNVCAPDPETNHDFMQTIAKILGKPFFMPNVPAILLKMLYGEMASTVIGGNRVSSEKIRKTGFEFEYDTLEKALRDLLKKS